MKKYVISLDQGTTSSKALLFDRDLNLIHKKQKELTQIYPNAGWVEHDPKEVYESSFSVINDVIKEAGISAAEICAIGITNQRETAIVWDRYTGEPVYNAIVWQCRRSASMCDEIKRRKELFGYIKENTGLIVDAYFSATKVKWILDNVEGAYDRAKNGDLLFGTVDSWLLYNFTKKHMTDSTNASRTMLFNIRDMKWDERLLSEFDIPKSMLPEVCPSGHVFGETTCFGHTIPIAALSGDQQSSLFGQNCFEKGDMKNTYGTGCFLLVNTGDEFIQSDSGMITTLASDVGVMRKYAVEGSVFTGGSVIQWLRDELGILESSAQSEEFALKVKDSLGVVFVPAFTGLGAPYWNMDVRGSMFGITRGTNKYHIARAALESIAFQCRDVIEVIKQDAKVDISSLKVDGGATSNNFLMQFQADITNMEIVRPKMTESTGFGAALLAGLTVGFFESKDEIRQKYKVDRKFVPEMTKDERRKIIDRWKWAVGLVTQK
ncbi:MAG TPA: glycerol kinase GlpK [Clostridia bacterium]|nr:glycerol kinase GlpK [Clostridiaceae bacterium]HPZ52280.1 glycerol kinase GlpK [Clostridia bacterium]